MVDGPTDDIGASLRKIANLLALDRIDGLGQQEQVAILNSAGFTHGEAADLLGTTPDTVRATVNRLKSKKTRGQGTASKRSRSAKPD